MTTNQPASDPVDKFPSTPCAQVERARPQVMGLERTSPVESSLPTTGGAWDNQPKDTTRESAPDQRRCSAGPGPRRPKGHDRLMDKVPPRSGSAPQAPCPHCGQTSTAGILRDEHGVCVADYRDGAGHIWTTKWMVPA